MSERRPPPDVQATLARAAAFGLAPQRRYAAAHREAALAFFLDQVKTCQLPRRMRLSAGQAPLLQADAAGGRLLRLGPLGDDALTRAFVDVLDRPLTAEDLPRVVDCLVAVMPEAAVLMLTLGRSDLAGSGLPPAQVFQALGLYPAAPDRQARLDTLFAAAEEVLIALYTGQDKTRLFRNGTELPRSLIACLDRLLAGPGGLIGMVGPEDMLCLTGVGGPDHGIGLLHLPEGPAALVFEAEASADLAAFWAEVPLMP